jgi:hypothetical protein
MEIVLMVAILAVGASALYVAVTFRKHVTHNLDLARKADLDPLARKTDLDPLMRKAVGGISEQATAVDDMQKQLRAAVAGQAKQTSTLHDDLNGKLEKLERQVSKVGTSLALQRELIAGIENHVKGQETQGVDPREMDALESAVLQAEAFVARDGWGRPPRLFSLARKSALVAADSELAAGLEDAGPDALIPVLQDDLPAGEPLDAIALIRWPEEVAGCVLVTEFVALPPEAEKDAPGDPAEAERWASERSDGTTARLAVGVTRAGGYRCCLRREGEDEVQVGDDLADDLVAALLGTF